MSQVLYRDNDNLVEFSEVLTDEITGLAVAAATVTFLVKTVAGVELQASGAMAAVGGEAGNYRGVVPDTLDLSAYSVVIVEVTADNGVGARAVWDIRCSVLTRT